MMLKNFSKAFGEKKVIEDLSFNFHEGEIFAFLGANGSGKTTTIRTLLNIYKADTGTDDNGQNINAVCQQAFSYFKSPGQVKHFKMVRPVFSSEGDINPAVLMNVDFQQNHTTVPPSFSGSSGVAWDVGSWDTSSWTSSSNLVRKWQGVTGVGTAGGIRVVTATMDIGCKWQATDIVYEVGGVL